MGVAAVLVAVLAGHRAEFETALQAAPLWILAIAALLQLVALLARSEAWHVCVGAAGGTVSRRRLFRAASLGNLCSQLNSQFGAAARIAALRRSAPDDAPRVAALIGAEVPIVVVEVGLAALASFTLIGPLGLPWWSPALAVGLVVAVGAGLRGLARGRGTGFTTGLAVLRSLHGRTRVVAFVLVAVFAQIARNWLMLRALGVDASVFDATAVLIAMVSLSTLPVGPSVGAAAVVLILGTHGVAATAAAGVLLTATGTAGALAYVGWAGIDRLRSPRAPALATVA
ncbi:MAG TPA: lysylphosphatidylglycerol synthase domain-containing protein [Solirubrobacteraceae bacterium]|nr:lysylphosphatidylglycerol synthase domain-containing protein [Solirubrobacteraceae bacterium]